MPNRIDHIFADLRTRKRRALMPFLVGGYPQPGMTGSLLGAAADNGASIVEVGFPFSDPIADGPVIAAAMHQALKDGATPATVMREVAEYRAQTEGGVQGTSVASEALNAGFIGLGLVAMVSISIVQRMGGAKGFAQAAARAGFDGLIVPDCPLEESVDLRAAAAYNGLSMALLIAPTTPPARAEEIAKASTGFIYLLARTGVTGEGSGAPNIAPMISRLRQVTPLPIAVGFGISSPEQARAVCQHADAAIIGSALVKRVGQSGDAARAMGEFVGSLSGALENLSIA